MTEMEAILRTIREVEVSLERRYARAAGVIIMIWGLVGFVIFGFYQLVHWNPAPYHEALGPLVSWVWVVAIAAGYVASALVGARLGRADEDKKRELRRGLLPGLVTSVLAAALLVAGREDLVYGVLTVAVGVLTFVRCMGSEARFMRISRGAGVVLTAVGAALLVWPVPWAPLVAALAFGVVFVGLGTVKYRLGE